MLYHTIWIVDLFMAICVDVRGIFLVTDTLDSIKRIFAQLTVQWDAILKIQILRPQILVLFSASVSNIFIA